MKKILLILAFICSVIYAAEPKDGDKVAITALYEGNAYEEGWILQFFDGKNRHYLRPSFSDLPQMSEQGENGISVKMLEGKIGYTYEIEYIYVYDEELEKALGTKYYEKITKIKELSGKPDAQLQKVRKAAEPLSVGVETDGAPKAANTLGVWYEKGQHSLPKDYKEAVYWYGLAANFGNTLAMHNLGDCYKKGIGVEKDINKAKEYYQMAINKGNAIGYEDLGDLYKELGEIKEAKKMYEQASQKGRKNAAKKLREL